MNASNFVEGVDFSLYLILAISVFFLVGITAVMIYFLIRYRKKNNPVATNIEGSHTLEIIWTVIPTILVLIMFWYGWTGYKPMLTAPKDAMEIEAVGQMWKWTFNYPNGKSSDTLVVPKDKAVKLKLVSKDVLHSLYIPAFRIKQDVVPGEDFSMWFIGQKLGRYDILCAEYCGQLHSYMLSSVHVIEPNNYEEWLNKKEDTSNEHPGLTLMKKNACLSCHTQDGTRLVGPSFKDIIGKTETIIVDGKEQTITVDKDYIRNKLVNPNSSTVKGYQAGLMPQLNLSDEEINDIVEYISKIK
ncbi:MAG: cytochrome c oxidase subunit II [Marinilabiliales bacterium]|nr:MAG: cytochrome c oxidase subunit II [Marinilabiliales bacterium]